LDVIPDSFPVFPLTGALLLPGGRLPLHVFEQRYRNMVEGVLAGDRVIGVIQPFRGKPETYSAVDSDESDPEVATELDHPELYEVGCVGLVERWERLPDERFIMLLRGVRRFRVSQELSMERGYRRVCADFDGFSVDQEDIDAEVSPDPLMGALRQFAEVHA